MARIRKKVEPKKGGSYILKPDKNNSTVKVNEKPKKEDIKNASK